MVRAAHFPWRLGEVCRRELVVGELGTSGIPLYPARPGRRVMERANNRSADIGGEAGGENWVPGLGDRNEIVVHEMIIITTRTTT